MKTVGIVGTGTMGCGIAQVTAQIRCDVIFQNRKQESVDRGLGQIRKSLEKLVNREKLTQHQADGILSRISGVVPLEELKGCDIVIESAPEDLELKQELLEKIDLAKSDLLRDVPGVGPNLARTLIAELPELGRISNKQIAALVGVAPLARDSGIFRGKRMVWGGRASVRSALYMSILSATKWNPVVRVFYLRLRAQGKPPKVAMVACMRKLLTILNAMVRDGRGWDPSIPLDQLRLQHSC